MKLWRLLFGFSGRIGRKTYWIAQTGLLVGLALSVFVLDLLARRYGVSERRLFVMVGAVIATTTFCNASVLAKRLHDRNRTSAWVWVAWALVLVQLGTMWWCLPHMRSAIARYEYWFVISRASLSLGVFGATSMFGFLPQALGFLISVIYNEDSFPEATAVLAIIFASVPVICVGLFLVIEAGFRRGNAGANRYGPAS